MKLDTRVKIEYMGILVFKVVPLVYSLIFASYFIQQPYVQIPYPLGTFAITLPFSIIAGLYTVEAWYLYKEQGKGIRSLTFETLIGMIGAFFGWALIAYVFLLKYSFSDVNTNTIYGWYIIIGAILIMIHARKEIFLHRAVTSSV